MTNNYIRLSSLNPKLKDAFFAFNNEQLAKGLKEWNLKKEDIFSGGAGLYGTKEGIISLLNDYDRISKLITTYCDPQEIYDYEFNNHECGYSHDDTDAIKIVLSYFDIETTRTVKRRNNCALIAIEDIKF